MATDDMKPIRVHIIGREYALRVREGEEKTTRHLAAQINARMEAFKDAHPEQADLTTSVITALAMAEELNDLRDELDQMREQVEAAREHEHALNQMLEHLSEQLAEVLPSGALPVAPDAPDPLPSEDYDPEVSSASDGHAGNDVSPPAPTLLLGSSPASDERDADTTDDDPSLSDDASGQTAPAERPASDNA